MTSSYSEWSPCHSPVRLERACICTCNERPLFHLIASSLIDRCPSDFGFFSARRSSLSLDPLASSLINKHRAWTWGVFNIADLLESASTGLLAVLRYKCRSNFGLFDKPDLLDALWSLREIGVAQTWISSSCRICSTLCVH
jgi:hypothetical protein